MKSVKFSALMAVAVIAASCAKEGTHSVDESNKVALEPMCIEASDESQTKTVLVGQSVNWTEGDEIAVYSNIDYTTGYRFPATDIEGNSATFNGKVPVGTESFFAVYPPERVVSVNKDGVTVNIPAEQTPAAGTFAEEHNITVAQGTKTPGVPSVGTITFNNVCSYVKFTVPAYVSDVKKVTIISGNAIAGDFATASSKIVSNGTNSISMKGSFGAGKTFLFVIAPGTVSDFSIYIETDSGKWTRTVSKGFDAKAGVPVKLGTVDFKQVELKAEAKHVYKDGTGALVYQDGTDKTLVGTDIIVNLGLLKYVSKFNFNVKKGDNIVRSYSRDSNEPVASPTVSITSTAYPDDPYLPQGEYTIEGSYTRPGSSTQIIISGKFTVPAPTFTVNATGMTSYSYYSEKKITQANECQAETIYGLGGTATISPTLLEKYRYSASYTLDRSETTAGDKVGQSWGQHTITATYTFDGVTVTSDPLTCHVTGLPYRAPSETKFNAEGKSWTKVSGGGTSINSDSIDLTPTDAPSAKSPAFHMPGTINVKVTNVYTKNTTSRLDSYTYKMVLNDNPEVVVVTHTSKKADTYSFTWTGEMNPNRTVFTCSYSYRARGNDVTVNSVIVEYK